MRGCGHAGPSPLTDQLLSSLSWDRQAQGEPEEEVCRVPALPFFCTSSETRLSTEGVRLRADANLWVTQSQLLVPCVVFLHEHSLELETLLPGGLHCFKQRSLLRAGCVCMASEWMLPIHRPTASPAEATSWEVFLFHCSPYLGSPTKQRFPEAQRLSLLPIVPASNASSPWTIRT